MAEILTITEVERIAALARLALTDEEKVRYAAQLARILEYAAQVAELDAEALAPAGAGSAGSAASAQRPDDPRPSLDRASALSNAPDTVAGLFRVPKVLGDA